MVDIYFIQGKDSIKIGRTQNLEQRIQTLQTSNHIKLEVLYIIKNMEPEFEKHVHETCGMFHISGEWFKPECIAHLMKCPWYQENMIRMTTIN